MANLWFIFSAELCLLLHSFFECFFLLLIFFHLIVSVAFIQIWVGEHVPALFPITFETSDGRSYNCFACSLPVVTILCPVVSVFKCTASPVSNIIKFISDSDCVGCVSSPFSDILDSSFSPFFNVLRCSINPVFNSGCDLIFVLYLSLKPRLDS